MLNREYFQAPPSRRFDTIDLPDGNQARIRSLNELERSQLDNAAVNDKGELVRRELLRYRCRVIAACLVDEEGNQLLSEADIPAIGRLDSATTTALYNACVKHCALEKKDEEGTEKNSEETGV